MIELHGKMFRWAALQVNQIPENANAQMISKSNQINTESGTRENSQNP